MIQDRRKADRQTGRQTDRLSERGKRKKKKEEERGGTRGDWVENGLESKLKIEKNPFKIQENVPMSQVEKKKETRGDSAAFAKRQKIEETRQKGR